MRLIPLRQMPYIRSHPLGLAVAIGLAQGGLVNLLFPSLVAESVVAVVFPSWFLYLFGAVWAVGGTLAAIGMLRGWRSIEAGGSALLAGGLLVYFGSVLSVRASSALVAGFILCLSIGYAFRAWHLATAGYDGTNR